MGLSNERARELLNQRIAQSKEEDGRTLLYPKERPVKVKKVRKEEEFRWKIDYVLHYQKMDGEYVTRWQGYYRWRWLALFAAWCHYHVSAGGRVVLIDQSITY